MWIIPKKGALPKFKSIELNFDNLTSKLIYAQGCIDCEPAVGSLYNGWINLDFLGEILKKTPKYNLIINVEGNYRDVKEYINNQKKYFWKNYQIKKDRIKLNFVSTNEEYKGTEATYKIMPETDQN